MLHKNRLRDKVRKTAEALEGAAEVNRLAILFMLSDGPLDVRQIVDMLGIDESLVSFHLKKLYATGWVGKIKYGRRVEYHLNPSSLMTLHTLFHDTPAGREVWPKPLKGEK
jgi:DNA-binding transcriptional ArsR family regulator